MTWQPHAVAGVLVCVGGVALVGCHGSPEEPARGDAGLDAGRPRDRDAGPREAGLPDAPGRDAGVRDAAVLDAAVLDGAADSGVADSGTAACGEPLQVGAVAVPGLPVSLAPNGGGFVYVAQSLRGLISIDARDPTAMVALGEIAYDQPSGIATDGDRLVITSHDGAFGYHVNVLGLSDPSSPSPLYVIDDGGLSRSEMLSGTELIDVRYSEVAIWTLGPASATFVGAVAVPAGAGVEGARDRDRVAVVGGGGTTWVIDVSSPFAPTVVAMAETGARAYGVAILGDRIYVAGSTLVVLALEGGALRVVDSVSYGDWISAVAIWRDTLVVLGSSGLILADPAAPSIHRAEIGAGGSTLAVGGDLAYIGVGGYGGPGFVYAVDLCP